MNLKQKTGINIRKTKEKGCEKIMKNERKFPFKTVAVLLFVLCFCVLLFRFGSEALDFFAFTAVKSANLYLPHAVITFSDEAETSEKKTEKKKETKKETEKTTEKVKAASITKTPDDISKLMKEAKEKSKNDKKDGAISQWQYTDEGVTDKFGVVKVKNVNKTQINIEKLLSQKADLSVKKNEPAVLIFHTHTTETYQLVDRDYYPTDNVTRSEDSARNMVRIGDAICEQLEKAGIGYIHDTKIHDKRYTGAYDNSRETAVEYLKKNPSIQVVLDVHRDAVERTDGTKIRPVATVNGKKAAQIMIISGCQEEGNGLTEFPDWKENLVFALQLQKTAEENFEGLMRPIYFCPRMYNMNLTHCSLLLEIGSDSNTLEEAEYSGQCIGNALSKLLKEYEE